MLSRINVFKILKDHFATLRRMNQPSNRISIGDFLMFIAVPVIVAFLLVYFNYSFKKQIGSLITAIAIFGGFLFNLLAIIYSQIDRIRADAESEGDLLKKKFVGEIHANISFCIVLALIIVLTLLSTTVDIPDFKYDWLVNKVLIGLNYFLLIIFVLSLIMVINRVYILLKRNISS